jgi:hypothetical protein
MIKKVALWALAGLILVCLVPSLIVNSERNISILSAQAQQAYAAGKCRLEGGGMDENSGKCWIVVHSIEPTAGQCQNPAYQFYWSSDGWCHDSHP